MSWLDKLIAITFQSAGTSVGTRQTLNFTGATVTDDPTNNRVNVAITDTGMTALTGDVTASGSGSVATTVAKLNSQLASAYVKTDASKNVTTSTSVPYSDIANTAGAAGDMLVGNASNQFDQLAIGASGTVLWSNGSKPGWVNNPTLTSLTLSGLTASKYVVTDGLKALASQTGVPRGDIANTGGATGDLLVGNGTALDRLAIGSAGQVLTVSGGTPAWAAAPSGGGSPTALDANHIYAYSCEDAVGSSVLANSGTGANGDLTLLGSAGTAYQLASRRLAKGRNSCRLLANVVTGGAKSGALCSVSGGEITIECYILIDRLGPTTTGGFLMFVDAGSDNDAMMIGLSNVTGGVLKYWAKAASGGVGCDTDSVTPYPTPIYGVPQHVMATFKTSSSPKLKLYVDGRLVASASGSVGALATMNRITIGNAGTNTIYAQSMNVMQVRVSNIERSAAYALAQAEACFAL